MTELLVLLNGTLAGRAYANKQGNPLFTYDSQWRSTLDAMPLSLSLPLAASEHASATVAAVLWGFLPDNEHVLQSWGTEFQVSPRNPLSLLANVGEDCAGAAQFVRPDRIDEILNSANDQSIAWLDESAVAERLREVRRNAGATRRRGDLGQFSLPGAQPKIALHRDRNKWGVPQGRVPTTHILKPPTGAYEGYAENEHFCLNLARRIGLSVCESAVVKYEDEIAICVRRYDRINENGRWQRIHQEDFCQAIGVMPQLKYQNDGGPSPAQIVQVLNDYSSEPKADRENFLLALIFNWVIGGTDAHAKNYSLLITSGLRVRLAPLYDISSALPYPDLDRRKLKMAMKVGNHYRWYEIRLADWLKLGRELGFSAEYMREVLRLVATLTPDAAASEAHAMQRAGIAHPIISRLVDEIARSAARCLIMLERQP